MAGIWIGDGVSSQALAFAEGIAFFVCLSFIYLEYYRVLRYRVIQISSGEIVEKPGWAVFEPHELRRNLSYAWGSFTSRRRAQIIIFLNFAAISIFTVVFYKVRHSRQSRQRWISMGSAQTEVPVDALRNIPERSYMPPTFLLQSFESWSTAIHPQEDFAILVAPIWPSMWWLQTHFAGLLNFSVFLAIEGRIYRFKPIVMFAFAWLSLTSLGFAQNMFYAYLLILPKSSCGPLYYHTLWQFYVLPGLAALYCFRAFPSTVGTWTFYSSVWFCIAVVLALPQLSYVRLSFHVHIGILIVKINVMLMIFQLLSPKDPWDREIEQEAQPEPKVWVGTWQLVYQSQTRVFMPLAIGSLILHWYSSYRAFHEVEPQARFSTYSDWQLITQQSWRYKLLFIRHLAIMYGAQYPGIAAVGWDVIISGLSSCLWAVVASISIPGMLRSTMMPTTQPFEINTGEDMRLSPLTRYEQILPILLGAEHDGVIPGQQLRPPSRNGTNLRPPGPGGDRSVTSGLHAGDTTSPGSSTVGSNLGGSSPGRLSTQGTSISDPSPAKSKDTNTSTAQSTTTGSNLAPPSSNVVPRRITRAQVLAAAEAAGEAGVTVAVDIAEVLEENRVEQDPVDIEEEEYRRIAAQCPLYVPEHGDGWAKTIGMFAVLTAAGLLGGLGFVNAAVHGGGLSLTWLW